MSDAVRARVVGIGVALVLLLAGGSVGWGVSGWRMGAALAEAREARVADSAESARAALADLAEGASKVRAMADSYSTGRAEISGKLDQLSKDFKSYAKDKPLPADCRPDAGRVRSLAEAVAAAKQAAAR